MSDSSHFPSMGTVVWVTVIFSAAPDSLIDNFKSVLDANEVEYQRDYESVVESRRHTYDLTVYKCQSKRATVELIIEKRHGRTGADILITPSRRFLLWHHLDSERLAESLAQIMCQHGADDSPDARCEDLE